MRVIVIPPGQSLIEQVWPALKKGTRIILHPWWYSRGKRPSHFLRKAIAAKIETSFIPPTVFSMDELVDSICEKCNTAGKIETIDAVALLYDIHRKSPRPLGGKGFKEFLKALMASQYIHRGYSREEMQDFLRRVDRVIGLERECDEALRRSEKLILMESTDAKEMQVFLEIARMIEESTNSLMKAVYTIRDSVLEGINW